MRSQLPTGKNLLIRGLGGTNRGTDLREECNCQTGERAGLRPDRE
jgi:hypothetical protein